MTTASSAAHRPAPVVRAAVLPSVVAGLVCAGLATILAGRPGLYGALAGALLVAAFLGFGHLTLQLMSVVNPQFQLGIALLTYGLQVVALLAVYAAFSKNPAWTEAVSARAVGVTIMVCAIVWSAGRVIAAGRERRPLFDTEDGRR